MLAQLALENTTYRFDKPFTYSVPQALETAVRSGVRVTVPFGAGNRTRVAMVLSTSYESGAGQKLKAIASVLDKEPLLDDEMLALMDEKPLLLHTVRCRKGHDSRRHRL